MWNAHNEGKDSESWSSTIKFDIIKSEENAHMMLRNKNEIEAYLRRNIPLHIYSIGDLDDFFWQDTQWHALKESDEIQALVLIYTGQPIPTLQALSEQAGPMQKLLRSIRHLLPDRFHAHLSPGVGEAFKGRYEMESCEKHYKMVLNNKRLPDSIDCSQVVRMTEDDLSQMLQFYEEAYPGNWFDPRMLRTKQYFGMKIDNKLVSVAGIHVYSKTYGVAALGNITTHPDYRGRGIAQSVTARLCQSLLENVDHIGLNVRVDNTAGIALYDKLGFEIVAPYYECMISTPDVDEGLDFH
jgi:RimJ/RimL family protein N-acetyltransferase